MVRILSHFATNFIFRVKSLLYLIIKTFPGSLQLEVPRVSWQSGTAKKMRKSPSILAHNLIKKDSQIMTTKTSTRKWMDKMSMRRIAKMR